MRPSVGASASASQIHNAAIITQVGRQMGMSTRDIQTAIITALVESNLNNVNYGDRDSLGLFQQRASWGSAAQRMNPYYAAQKFFSALKGVTNRDNMSMGAAAQAVQRSAFPGRYQERIGEMREMWPSIAKAAGEDVRTMDGDPYPTDTLSRGGSRDLIPSTTTVIPWQGPEYDPNNPDTQALATPDAATMLGAWGMDSPQPVEPVDPNDGTQSMLSPETYTTYIQPMLQQSGNFQKGVDGWRGAVLQAARTALGTPYVWGGNSLQNGVDCSGLVQQAFAQAGISLPRVSYQQANSGQRVGINGLQPGDLVAWDNSSRNNGADHIAIYLGNGNIIEAPRPGLAVRIRHIGKNLDGGWGVHLNE